MLNNPAFIALPRYYAASLIAPARIRETTIIATEMIIALMIACLSDITIHSSKTEY
jgi:hypothetical protein